MVKLSARARPVLSLAADNKQERAMRRTTATGTVIFSLLASLGALAVGTESTPMPPDIAAKIKEFGRVITPPQVAPIYAPLQEQEPYKNVKVTRDVKYGSADRNLLDVFSPEGAVAGGRPVLIFVHGGAFTAGNKRAPGSPFYDNIMLMAVRGGGVGVNVTYRLAPANPWPAAGEDLKVAVRWVIDNIAAHGGDPKRIVLMGRSAGAVHVATYVAHPQFHAAEGSGVAGAILLSGVYDIGQTAGDPERAYFGADASKYAERSSLAGLVKGKTPLMVVYAELDPPSLEQQANLLKDSLCKESRCPEFKRLANHSHISEVYSLNTKDTELSDLIGTFVQARR
jgi:acetyl esterase/lipase